MAVEDDSVHITPIGDSILHERVRCVCGPTVEPVLRADGSSGWLHLHHRL